MSGGWFFPPPEVRPMGYIDERVPAMSVYESISLMLLFGTFLLALLTYIDHHKKIKNAAQTYFDQLLSSV